MRLSTPPCFPRTNDSFTKTSRCTGAVGLQHFKEINREAHYVGTFTSQTEALAAYYERTQIWKIRTT